MNIRELSLQVSRLTQKTLQGLAIGLVGFVSLSVAAVAAVPTTVMTQAQQTAYLKQHMLNTRTLRPHYMLRPPNVMGALTSRRIKAPAGAGPTIPYWTTNITSPLDHHTYTVSMMGSSPFADRLKNTIVPYVPLVLRIHLAGFVLDPTQTSPCDTQSASTRFFLSPLFVPNEFVSNGANVSRGVFGGTQLVSAFQRANFWRAIQDDGNYGITLFPTKFKPIVVDWYPTNPSDFVAGVPDNCGGANPVPIALLEINEVDAELQAIAAQYAVPTEIPITLLSDVAIYIGTTANCCVLGYHNAIPLVNGTQTYAVGAYFDTNSVFGPDFADTTIWSHELAELTDDPFVQSIANAPGGLSNDITPNWGNTGQVSGCDGTPGSPANLEVGDPLTPDQLGNFHNYAVTGVGGFVYHYQDLAFHDWFYRTRSTSTGGKGSFVGNFAGGGQPTICQ